SHRRRPYRWPGRTGWCPRTRSRERRAGTTPGPGALPRACPLLSSLRSGPVSMTARSEEEQRAMRWPDSPPGTDAETTRIFRGFEAARRAAIADHSRRAEHNPCSDVGWRRHIGDKTLSENHLRGLPRDGAKCTWTVQLVVGAGSRQAPAG